MTTGTATGGLDELLRRPLEPATGEATVVSDDGSVLEGVVRVLAGLGADAPRVRALSSAATLDAVGDDFLAAARATDLVEADRLVLRTAEGVGTLPSLLVTTTGAVAVAPLPDGSAVAFETDEEAVVSTVREAFSAALAAGEEYRFGVPGYTRLLDTLDTTVGTGVRDDFAAALDAAVTVRGPEGALDEIDTALLLGARNRAQLYELSEWAESVGLASRATVSARKRRLEAAGLLATEKIATDVGRPRQRLLLADDSLVEIGVADLVRAARSVLIEGPGH